MKCVNCPDYENCRKMYDLRSKRHNCVKALEPDPVVTNADRIRAMSDEELAEAIMSGAYCNSECPPDAGCHDCCLAWLKQPVKDGEDDVR